MPELPEITNLARQMDQQLRGKRIVGVEVRQEKVLNLPLQDFTALVLNKTIGPVTAKGKWVFMKLEPDAYFLLSLGMGGEVLHHEPGEALPDKYRLRFDFADGSALSINFWWFGYAHAVLAGEPAIHKMTAALGPSPLDPDFSYEKFGRLLEGKRGGLKAFLMDQKNVAGIGNVYIQDILFRAKLHPNRGIPTLTEDERRRLYEAIRGSLKEATDLGGLRHERDLFNQIGRWDLELREGHPCPRCGTPIEKIKTGSTSSVVCPACQKMTANHRGLP
ncbi:MAG: Fpg/Nei family DNA glycosylase [Bacillota bacterium]